MYFFIDTKSQTVEAFKTLGYAAREALNCLEIECPEGADPVALANQNLGDKGLIVNVSGAFESIAESDDKAAQELALQFKQAIDNYYKVRK